MLNILKRHQPVLDSLVKKMNYSDLFTLNKLINFDNYSLTQMTEKGLHEIKYFIYTISNFRADPTTITCIFFQYKQLAYLPVSIGLLKQLKHLYLHDNEFTEIPDGIFSLENLIQLDLGNNYITEIDEKIMQLSKLIDLDLSYNLLTSIPEFIHKLNLKSLDVTGNNLQANY